MKNIIIAAMTLIMANAASAIPVGVFGELNNWATSASRISGTGGDYAGVDAVTALIGDDLTDGAINISGNSKFMLDFAGGITNGAGNDFVIFDARFSADSVYVEVNGNEQMVASDAFIDSTLDLVLKNSAYSFDLFGANLDLSNWGIGLGDTIYSLNIRGVSESDIMGVSGLGGVANVPEPSTALLFSLGLAGLGFARRKKA